MNFCGIMGAMKNSISILLVTTPEEMARLSDLQRTFADLCNALTPLVQRTGCWSRVALHHLAYRSLRTRFPQVGSQIACNAIYSVSRAYRLVGRHLAGARKSVGASAKVLPLLRFRDDAPVFLDFHTVSVRGNTLSLYTLGGRMRLPVALTEEEKSELSSRKIHEIVLSMNDNGVYRLTFAFLGKVAERSDGGSEALNLPRYLMMEAAGEPDICALAESGN